MKNVPHNFRAPNAQYTSRAGQVCLADVVHLISSRGRRIFTILDSAAIAATAPGVYFSTFMMLQSSRIHRLIVQIFHFIVLSRSLRVSRSVPRVQ